MLRNLVRQMSVATSQLPGSVGEGRRMRQELVAIVHQIETETADLEYNNGAGTIPAGICTLTCPVYKSEQLFHTVDLYEDTSASPNKDESFA